MLNNRPADLSDYQGSVVSISSCHLEVSMATVSSTAGAPLSSGSKPSSGQAEEEKKAEVRECLPSGTNSAASTDSKLLPVKRSRFQQKEFINFLN